MKPRALVGAVVVACALAVAACPQFESDFTIAPGAVDATTGDDVTTKAPDAASDVADTGALDASSGDVLPDGSSADAFVDGSVDGGTGPIDAGPSDAGSDVRPDAGIEAGQTPCCVIDDISPACQFVQGETFPCSDTDAGVSCSAQTCTVTSLGGCAGAVTPCQ
jgi:hypothetical protein